MGRRRRKIDLHIIICSYIFVCNKKQNKLKLSNNIHEILTLSLSNLSNDSGINATWIATPNDPIVAQITINYKNKTSQLNAEIRSVLLPAHLPQLLENQKTYVNFFIVAGRISRDLSTQLKELEINYLDSGGNTFINTAEFLLFIEGKKSGISNTRKHLFTNSSIVLLFHLMMQPDLLKVPYREITEKTGASLDSISKTIRILKENDTIVELQMGGYAFVNKKILLERWISAYGERLKPKLLLGRFRFLKDVNWNDIKLETATSQWGGEPAIDILFNQLRPQIFTIYSTENKQEIIKKYKLIPDANGPVYIYHSFWNLLDYSSTETVPELLIYTDLLLSGSARNAEMAKTLMDAREKIILQSV